MSSKIPDVHPCLRFYAGVAQPGRATYKVSRKGNVQQLFWLLTRGSQVQILTPAQNNPSSIEDEVNLKA